MLTESTDALPSSRDLAECGWVGAHTGPGSWKLSVLALIVEFLERSEHGKLVLRLSEPAHPAGLLLDLLLAKGELRPLSFL